MTATRPVVLVDAAIPDEPLAPLEQVAEVVRYANDGELDVLLRERGPEVKGLGVLLTTKIGSERLSRAPNVRVVANYAVGIDNVDLEEAAARGIVVTNTPDVLTEATADLTWALILAVARRLPEGMDLIRSGRWEGWHPRQLLGKQLQGASLAILGLGRIGSAVVKRGLAFGMRVAYWSRTPKPELEDSLGLERVELDVAIERANVLSIHLPLTDDTRYLMHEGRIARMKPDAILVNTARGPIVDEAALAAALDRGHLFGAGLDVYEREPEIHAALLRCGRVVLLPHLGSATVETREAMADIVVRKLIDGLRTL